MQKRIIFLVAVSLVLANGFEWDRVDLLRRNNAPREDSASSETSSSGLPKGVTILYGTNASITDNTDLLSFSRLARRASIFAIGESAHGVAGFQSFQFRLSKFLIENYGYRKILSEIVSDDRALNQYLLTGVGNLNQILYLNPWHGDDVQMRSFFQWIAQWNALNPDDTVTVHVVDPQAPWLNAPIIQNFLQAYNPQLEQQYFPIILQNCFGAKFNNQIEWAYSPETTAYYATGGLPQNETDACIGTLSTLRRLLRRHRHSIIREVGETLYGDAVDAVRSLASWQEKSALLFTDTAEALAIREAAFGPSVLWKWRRENPDEEPAILLAHSIHISKNRALTTYLGDDEWVGLKSVGYQLKKELDDGYVNVGQSGFNVSAMFRSAPYPFPNDTRSIDYTLRQYGEPLLLLRTDAHWVRQQGEWYVHEEGIKNGRFYDLPTAFNRYVFQSSAPGGKFLGNIN